MVMRNVTFFRKEDVSAQDSIFTNPKESVVSCIEKGNKNELASLIDKLYQGGSPDTSFNFLSKNKELFVVTAIEKGHIDILRYLLNDKFRELGVNGTITAKNKSRFILAAIKLGNSDILKILLNKVNDAAFKDMDSKMSLVEFAIRKGNKDIVEALLNKLGSKDDTEALTFRASFVPVAIFEGQSDILKVLLDKLSSEQVESLISEENLFVAIHKGIAVFRLLFKKLCLQEGDTMNYKKFLDILPKSRLVNEVCRTGDVDLMMFVLGEPRLFSHSKGGNNLDPDAYKLFRALLRKRASIPQKAWLENSCAQTFLTTVQKLKQQVKIEKEETGFRSFWRRIVSFFSYGRDSKEKCLERAEKIDLFDIALQYSDADLKTFVNKIENASIVDYLRERLDNGLDAVEAEASRLLSVLSNKKVAGVLEIIMNLRGERVAAVLDIVLTALSKNRVVAVIDTLTSRYDSAELSAFIKKLKDDKIAIYLQETSSGDSKEVPGKAKICSEEQGNSSTLSLRLFSPRNSQISDDVKPQTFADPQDDNGGPRCRAGII